MPFVLLFILLFGISHNLTAQSKPAETAADSIWSNLQRQLEQTPTDSVDRLAIPLVRSHCGGDPFCQYPIYKYIMVRLERQFRILAAVSICKEMENVILLQGDSAELGGVYINYSRYYHALGQLRLMTVYLDKAEAIFERHGSYLALTNARMFKLERSLNYRKMDEVLADMDTLLANAILKGDSSTIYYLHGSMIEYKINAGRYDEAERHIAAIEQMPVRDPVDLRQVGKLTMAARSRAKLAVIRKNPDEAVACYQKALHFLTIRADPWMEVDALLSLTELEWDRGHRAQAKAYLQRAETRAIESPVEHLLPNVFAWHARIAETEGRLAEALEYTKKYYTQKEDYQNRSTGFDQKNYFLQQEKEQLATEHETQALELHLNKAQLRSSLLLAVFVLILAAFLFFGYYKQRTAKRELATQNALIQQQAEQLKTLDAAKSRFFANVSHELRTPLTLILGPVGSLLDDTQLSKKQFQLLHMVQKNGKQLEQLVDEILDLRKLEMGKLKLQEEPTELGTFFRRCVAQFESLAERNQIDLVVDVPSDKGIVANIDQAKCRQIVNNLLSNAFKFTPDGGRIKFNLSVNTGILALQVADTGPGIHPGDLPHVFDRFFQTSRPDKPAEGGTGIGLNLCQEYAHLFGGDITVESIWGQGSVFRVAFPITLVELRHGVLQSPDIQEDRKADLRRAAFAGHAPEPAPLENAVKSKPALLVVEDNPDLQEYLRLILSEKYEVVTAEHGQAALDILTRSLAPPGLILSDLMMPVMDGFQLLERLKSDDATRHIPVIMLTARAEARDRLKALRIGVDDYLLKPFDEEELLVRIDNLLKNQAARFKDIPVESESVKSTPILSLPDQEWLETLEAYVQKNLLSSTLTVSALAYEFAMSESTLFRQVKRLTGLTPVHYLQEMRLDKARQLLENRVYNSIAQVASKVGYEDAGAFSRRFRQRYGKLPSEVLGA